MNTEFETLKITDILLDEQNPRFSAVTNQKEAIDSMIDDQGEKLLNLAKDICESGLDPSKRLLAFREKGKLIDGDGNRRLTALKILETPSLASSNPSLQKKFELLRKQFKDYPTKVDCVILKSREAAQHWIEINHGGELAGRGQIGWNPEQNARFRGELSIGLAATDVLLGHNFITEDEKTKVKKTNLDRILNYRITKDALSIATSGDKYTFGDLNRLHQLFVAMKGVKVERIYRAESAERFLIDTLGDLKPTASNSRKTASGSLNIRSQLAADKVSIRTRRSKTLLLQPFGGPLSLRAGDVNDLYRDIESLYRFYQRDRTMLSPNFIVLFRMSLRLLSETAAKDNKEDLQNYLKNNFDTAKAKLDQDAKTSLSNQNVKKDTIIQLLQNGAHDYSAGKNEHQAIAISIILGAILTATHPK